MLHLLLSLFLTALAADTAPEPLDYALLSHEISVDSLRAGNHDPSGTSEYVFAARMYGLLNSSEERNLAFDKRQKVAVELGKFGDTKMDALSIWKPDEKTKDVKELKIEGNGIRELVAKTMTDLKVGEGDVCVQVEVQLLQRKKKLLVLHDETPVAQTSYYVIPPTKFDAPLRTNQVLTISDDKGTLVKVGVRYEKPATPPK
jgi:hypothetical protein